MPKSIKKSSSKKDRDQKQTIQGSHHMKARREEIVIEDSDAQPDPAGELRIKGLRTAEDRGDILALVASVVRQAEKRYGKPQVSRLATSGQLIVADTVDGKLAEAIGRRLHRARKGGELTITWAGHDVPVLVIWQAPNHKSK